MLDLNTLRVDPSLATEGAWKSYSGAEFLIARYNNRAAENARATLSVEFYSELTERDGKITDEDERKFQKVQNKVLAEHVLKGWKNVALDGKKLEYSPEAAFKILDDEGFEDLRQFIINEAIKRENFIVKETKAIEKDVKPSANS